MTTEVARKGSIHRKNIEGFERLMLEQETIDIPPVHHFSKGLYARELRIPKGTIISGKIHKYENLNIMSQGELSILTETGVKRVKAPFTVISPPGTKRLAYAHEDTVWTTIHATEERDVDKIEAEFIAQSDMEYLEFVKMIEDKS